MVEATGVAKNFRITKSNALITARYKQKYTIHEQKTILWILSQIDYSGSDLDKEYVLSVKEYAETVGIHPSNIYREAKAVAEGLSSKTIKIENPDGSWMVCSWLSGMRYEKGNLYIEIYSRLKPHLLKLKEQFTSYQLGNILVLNSVYAIRLYELLAQRRAVGECTFSLNELRDLLGIQKSELVRFNHFKTKVLDISVREINSKTDISFKWEPIKVGRKVDKIKFFLEETPTAFRVVESNNPECFERLIDLGFKKDQAEEILSEHEDAKIIDKLDYIKGSKGKIKNPCGFLLKSLKENYQFTKSESAPSPTQTKIQDLKLALSQATSAINSHLAKSNPDIKSRYEKEIERINIELKELASIEKTIVS
jgi:plasmid replication initiation protein